MLGGALLWLTIPTVAWSGELPLCGDPPAASPVPVDGACAAADLQVGTPILCVSDCAGPAVEAWIPVGNGGSADAAATTLSLVLRDGTGDVPYTDLPVPALKSGDGAMIGPVTVTVADWTTATLIAAVDSTNKVTECVEGGSADLGPWPDPRFDADGDGVAAATCGGRDCDDDDATVHPGALDVVGDGIDQDCSGADAAPTCDLDGDGEPGLACGGADCDDLQATVHPGAADIEGDGVDQDCDGKDACSQEAYMTGGLSCSSAPADPAGLSLLLAAVGGLAVRRRRC